MAKRQRENLVGKLDLLLAQGDPLKARFKHTKENLEGLQLVKKAKLFHNPHLAQTEPQEPQEVDTAEVLRVQRQIAQKKVHYGDKELLRALKVAQKSEIAKVTKKIKALQEGKELQKRSTKELTVEDLELEIATLKEMDIEEFSRYQGVRVLQKGWPCDDDGSLVPEYLPDWYTNSKSDRWAEYQRFRDAASKLEINLHSRLTSSKGVRTASEAYVARIKKALGEDEGRFERSEADQTARQAQESSHDQQSSRAATSERATPSAAVKTDAKTDAKAQRKAERLVKAEKAAKFEQEDGDDSDSDNGSDDDSDGFFEGAGNGFSAAFSDDEEDYPALAAGYISGSDDEEADKDRMVRATTTKQKSNRRGQRARQKIWEAKYGDSANHNKKERQDRYDKSQVKQKEYEEREARRTAKRDAMTPEDRAKQDEWKLKKEQGVPPPRISHRDDVGQLHPSWLAKKAQSNVSFAGKKVVFGESPAADKPKPKMKGPSNDDEGPLHPSWEAKKAKSASIAFAGKKKTF